MALADLNGNGELDYSEWLVATTKRSDLVNSKKLQQAFQFFDKDGSGKIDRKELKAALEKLQVVATDKQVRAMIKSVDTNQDGEVDFTEFVQLACKTHAHAVVWLTVLLVRTSSPPVSLQLCDRVSSFSDSSRLR